MLAKLNIAGSHLVLICGYILADVHWTCTSGWCNEMTLPTTYSS